MATHLDPSRFMPYLDQPTPDVVYLTLHTAPDPTEWKVTGTGYPKPTKGSTMTEAIPEPTGRAVERRHPAQVTADRLVQQLGEFVEYLSPCDRMAFARVIDTLTDISEGRR